MKLNKLCDRLIIMYIYIKRNMNIKYKFVWQNDEIWNKITIFTAVYFRLKMHRCKL